MDPSELGIVIGLATAVVGLTVPCWASLIGAVPVVMMLSRGGIIPSIATLGSADFEAYDLLIVVVVFRLASRSLVTRAGRRLREGWRLVGWPLLAFFGSLTVATVLAARWFGHGLFVDEIVPLLRFLGQAIGGLTLAAALRTTREVDRGWALLQTMGYLAGLSVFGSVALWALGIGFGEVSEAEGITRWFGPIGDEVGFVLALFVFWDVFKARWLRAGWLMAAVFLTGTRGALIVLVCGAAVMALSAHELSPVFRRRIAAGLATGAAGAMVLWWLDPGDLSRRFTESMIQQGVSTRIETNWAAVRMVGGSPLTGVGYQGFRLLRDDYGSGSDRVTAEGEITSNAANQFLQTAADGGLLALAALLWLIVRIFRLLGRERTGVHRIPASAASTWLWALLVGGQTIAWLVPSSIVGQVFWLAVGLLVAGVVTRDGRASKTEPAFGNPSLATPR